MWKKERGNQRGQVASRALCFRHSGEDGVGFELNTAKERKDRSLKSGEFPRSVQGYAAGSLLTSGSLLLFSKLQAGIFSCALLQSPQEEGLKATASLRVVVWVSGQRAIVSGLKVPPPVCTLECRRFGAVCVIRASPGGCSVSWKRLPA